MSWVQVIFDFLARFWPFQIVYSYQKGVRFWCGTDTAELEPGLYAFIPGLGHIECINVVQDIIRLENQNLTTKDGYAVIISANVVYEIFDARLSFCSVQHLASSLADECRSQISHRLREYDYTALLSGQGVVEEASRAAIDAVAEEWGVSISRVSFADFSKTKVLSLAKI